jgi:PBP1b-binding outer membrane lipoprotein LpoB
MLNRSVAFIVLVLLLSGCSSKEADRYYNKKDNFSV